MPSHPSRLPPIILAASIVVIAACSALPFTVGPSGFGVAPTPAPLARCDNAPVSLCLVSFGLQEPAQMLIRLFVPVGSPRDISMQVVYKDKRSAATCELVNGAPTAVDCTTALVPLGAAIRLEVFGGKAGPMLARGEFVVSALALPTQMGGGTVQAPQTIPGASTPRPPASATMPFLFPNLSPMPGDETGTPFPFLPFGTANPFP